MTLLELSALLYDQDALTTSTENKSFVYKKMGAPSYLEFYDPATLLYSGMTTERLHPTTNHTNNHTTTSSDPFMTRWQGLMIV
jgi:hypothetical protein